LVVKGYRQIRARAQQMCNVEHSMTFTVSGATAPPPPPDLGWSRRRRKTVAIIPPALGRLEGQWKPFATYQKAKEECDKYDKCNAFTFRAPGQAMFYEGCAMGDVSSDDKNKTNVFDVFIKCGKSQASFHQTPMECTLLPCFLSFPTVF
jgi:hypothetical protein